MTTRTITAREATIKTATVEVKALTISGRQVTLSVFRQLKAEQVIDPETLLLRGACWGIVNYFWGDDAKRHDDPLHVVWQLGNELRRAIVPSDLYAFRYWDGARDSLDICLRGFVLHGVIEGNFPGERQWPYTAAIDGRRVKYDPRDWRGQSEVQRKIAVIQDYPNAMQRALEQAAKYSEEPHSTYWRDAPDRVRQERDEAVTFLQNEAEGVDGECSYDDFRQSGIDIARSLNDAEVRWAQLWQSLESLDHLFIAT